MPSTLVRKLLEAHRVSGGLDPGEECELRAGQVLLHDAGGALALRQLELTGVGRVECELAVCYVDHQAPAAVLGAPDLPRFLREACERFGLWYSGPGNGICHQVHAERFAAPGRFLMGLDSHTVTAGALGMLAISVTPLQTTLALTGRPQRLRSPRVVGVELQGELPHWVGGKDLALEMLRRLGLRGAWGEALEFHGAGVASLPVAARMTVANLAAETGAWACVFPSDERTRAWLRAQGRDAEWKSWTADAGARYERTLQVDLAQLEPLIAGPNRMDAVQPARAAPWDVRQVCIGSCTNGSAADLRTAAALLAGRRVHDDVELVVIPGSRQVLSAIEADGSLEALRAAGARLLESYCGPCIGRGATPASGSVSVRSFSRAFAARSGAADAHIVLAGPESCAAAALAGRVRDPREVADGRVPPAEAEVTRIDDALLQRPLPALAERGAAVPKLRCPEPFTSSLRGPVLLRLGHRVPTELIVPPGAMGFGVAGEVAALAERAFSGVEPAFAARARAAGGGVLVAGTGFGLGSARPEPALALAELGVRAVLALSFARAQREHLAHHGVLPLVLGSSEDYERLRQGDELEIPGLPETLQPGRPLGVRNLTRGVQFIVRHELDPREVDDVAAGGVLARIARAVA